MICWHCENELEFKFGMADPSKYYHCPKCEKWYEMRKDKEKVNGAVPVRFFELDSRPAVQTANV